MKTIFAAALAAGWLGLAAGAGAEPTLVWTNITGSAMWNTLDANWVGSSNYADGYGAYFRPNMDARAVKSIYIGTAGPTPVDIAPGGVQWSTNPSPGGIWLMSGGGITGGASLLIGWDANVIFTNYGADIMTFTNGVIIDSGWLTFAPTNPGAYHFGTGPIVASRRGNYVGFRFSPTVPGCTLVNDFIVPGLPVLGYPQGGANWYGTLNGGKILGTVTLNGPLAMQPAYGPGAATRLDASVILTGNRTISCPNSAAIYAAVDGANTHTLSLDVGGNNDAYTDWYATVANDTNTPIWTIGGFAKYNTGNAVMRGYRDLGEAISLRTGALILGGLGSTHDLIRDTASINLQGGKLLLRRDTTGSQEETVGGIRLEWGHNELRLTPTNNSTYTLASTSALFRANRATGLVAANDLGGQNGASGSGRVTFPEAPPLAGGGGSAGGTTVSIVPFLIGGLSTDHATTLQGNSGHTFVTYDPASGSLRNLDTATEFLPGLFTAGPDDNVRRTASETLMADKTVNSLILEASGATPLLLDGPHVLTLNSGALLVRGASGRGSTVDVAAVDFAGGEGIVSVVDTAPNQYGNTWLTINSEIRNGGLTKAGYGRLELRGNSTFTGPFVMNSGHGGYPNNNGVYLYGTLATTNIQLYGGGTWLMDHQRLPSNAAPRVDTRATLYLNGKTQMLANVRSGPSGGGTVNLGTGGTLVFDPPADEAEGFTGTYTAGSLIKNGPHLLTISGPLAVGFIYLNDGILRRTAASSGNPKVAFRGGLYELAFPSRDWSYSSGAYSFGPGGGGWSAKGGDVTIFPEAAAPEWGVTANFVLDGDPLMFNSPMSDALVRYDRSINLGTSAGVPKRREIRVGDNPDSAADYAYLFSPLSGAADKVLWKTGAGLLQLYSANTYAGGLRISDGTVQVSTDGGFGAVPAAASTNVTFDGGGLRFAGALTVAATRTMLIETGCTASLDTLGNAVTVAGRITGGGAGAGLLKLGAGTLTLSGVNDYAGSNTISNGTVAAGSAAPLGAPDNPLAMGPSATLNLNGQNVSVGALTGDPGALIVNAASGTATNTLTLSISGGTARFGGCINNGNTRKVAFTKMGGGTQALDGDNGYTGPTAILDGTLLLNGSNATASVSVGAGTALGGGGFIAGNVTVLDGGTVRGGASGSPGILTIGGNLALQEGSRVTAEAGDGVMSRVQVNGVLTVPTNAVIRVDYDGGGWPEDRVLFSATALAGVTEQGRLDGWTVENGGTVLIQGTSLVFRRSAGAMVIVK